MTGQGEDILAWLQSALRTREETARAAAALQDDPENGWGIVDDSGYAQPSKRRTISPHIGITHEPESAQHIVLNNPADVLRRCAADRKLLGRHTPHHYGSVECSMRCERAHPGVLVCNHDERSWPCPDVVDLAEGYGWTEGE